MRLILVQLQGGAPFELLFLFDKYTKEEQNMPRKQKKYHFIYKTTNILNDKFYIGMHSTNNLDDGYIGSGKKLWYSINKYGKENHRCEILEFCFDRKALSGKEAEIVDDGLLQDPMCMNLTLGGGHGWDYINNTIDPEEMRRRGNIGNKKIKILKESDPDFLKKWIEQKSNNGKIVKEKQIGIFSPSIIGTSFLGKIHSEESKEKMRKGAKGKHVGDKNSQYGTCWIYNEKIKECKKIKTVEEIPNGWLKGRKLKW